MNTSYNKTMAFNFTTTNVNEDILNTCEDLVNFLDRKVPDWKVKGFGAYISVIADNDYTGKIVINDDEDGSAFVLKTSYSLANPTTIKKIVFTDQLVGSITVDLV